MLLKEINYIIKKVLPGLCLIIFSYNITAQSKQITLPDLIKMFVPDSVKPGQIGEWSVTTTKNKYIKWTKFHCNDTSLCVSEGKYKLRAIKEINENKSPSCKLQFLGTVKGYTEFTISNLGYFEKDIKDAKALILGKANGDTLFNYCQKDQFGFSYATYKIAIPGKIPFWITFITSTLYSKVPKLEISLYLGKYTGPVICN